jgi:NAD(P) transhydrogenase
MSSYDMLVIGSGPAGQHAAIQAAKLGKRVAVVDRKHEVGGVCLNTGTIPSKTLREAVLYLTGIRQRSIYGLSYAVKRDITVEDLRLRTDFVMIKEREVILAQLERNHVDLLVGTATFVDPHGVRVDGPEGVNEYTADRFVIASGSRPAHAESIPLDGTTIVDSDMFLRIPAIPASLIVVGAGVIGVEYACMIAALGIPTTLIESRDEMLEFVDSEIVESLRFYMRELGVTFRFGEAVVGVRKLPDGQVVADLKSNKQVVAAALLYTVGRQGDTAELNLTAAGLTADARGRLAVDERYRTVVEHIYAVGDVIGFPALASTSMEQGRLAACHAFGSPATSLPHLFPYGIYTIPEISYVGQNENQLTAAGVPYEVGLARYREIARGNIIGDEHGMLKLLFHRETRALLGVHIIGEGATELIHIGQAVLSFGGEIDYFVHSVFNYPTLAECYRVAALTAAQKIA